MELSGHVSQSLGLLAGWGLCLGRVAWGVAVRPSDARLLSGEEGRHMSGSTFLFVALAVEWARACAYTKLDRGAQRAPVVVGRPGRAKLGILVVNVSGCFPAGAAAQLVCPRASYRSRFDGFLGGFGVSTALVDAVTLWAGRVPEAQPRPGARHVGGPRGSAALAGIACAR